MSLRFGNWLAQAASPVFLICWLVGSGVEASADPKRTLGVEDLVRFASIGDPLSLTWNQDDRLNAAWSPNGQQVAIVVRRGNPVHGTNDADLLVYARADLLKSAPANVAAHFASTSNSQPLAFVHWLADNKTLMFAGTQPDALPQVYQYDLRTRELTQRTHADTTLLSFDISASGNRLVTFSEQRKADAARRSDCMTGVCRITAEDLYGAQTGFNSRSSPVLTVYGGPTGKSRDISDPSAVRPDIGRCSDRFRGGLSPDGKHALWMCNSRANAMPPWWSDYTVDSDLTRNVSDGDEGYARRLMLVDVDAGSTELLSDAPFLPQRQGEPLWIEGGKKLILPVALESLRVPDPAEREERRGHWAVLIFDVKTRTWQRIARLDRGIIGIRDSSWDAHKQILMIELQPASGNSPRVVGFQRKGEQWQSVTAQDGEILRRPKGQGFANSAITLEVEQSLNDPPILVASNGTSGPKTKVLDPNEWLKSVDLGRVDVVTWSDQENQNWRAGLYYPPQYEHDKRYPLLIQTHGFDEHTFSLTGIGHNFPGRAAASKGLLVLQMPTPRGVLGMPAEWTAVQAEFESAIDYLDSKGLIDRSRVGLQGWSRSGPHVGYMLTHSSYPIAAAAFTSSGDFGWWWYMAMGAYQEIEADYGAKPFGTGLERWMKLAPSFNLEHVTAPMLMWENVTPVGLWDWYAGLRRLNKPVEYWLLPDGVHDAFKIRERIGTTALLVDWFAFWLKDEQDPNPDKRDQYSRWNGMRDQLRQNGVSERLRSQEMGSVYPKQKSR